MSTRIIKSIVFVLFAIMFAWSLMLCSENKAEESNTIPSTNNYVGDITCQTCHAEEHTKWVGSHHDMAMKPATSEFVRGDFSNTKYAADGVSYRFYKTDSIYMVDVTELEGNTTPYSIAYTFGWEPLQQYLVKFPKGNYQTLRVSWDTKENKWFHQSPDTIIPTNDWLHWTGVAQIWNTMCASCHSTNVQKNFTESTRSYNTTYDIINVSCEACHGPGEQHVAAMQPDKNYSNTYYAKLDKEHQELQLSVCGTCHGRRTTLTMDNNPHTDFMQFYLPDLLTTSYYFADGQQQGEVYKYASFLSSKMYRYGVTCTDCHDPHSAKIKFEGNALCLQCHEPKYDSPSHHFHAENSLGSKCMNCHMDGRYYMVNDFRHDHSFRVPRPDQSVQFGTPNACNSCHENKSAEWAAEAVKNWYGPNRKYHFSDDLIPGSLANNNSLAHLQHLMIDTAVNAIVKATAITYLADLNQPQAVNTIVDATNNVSEIIRASAYTELLNYREQINISVLLKGLTDPVLAVRLAAFRTLANPQIMKIEDQYLTSYSSTQLEYLEYLMANADFASGQVIKGEYYQELGDLKTAEYHYLLALDMDKLLEGPRLNLSVVYSQLAQPEKTREQLNLMMQLHPENDLGFYYAALLVSEENNYSDAAKYLSKAISLNPNPTYYYNYVLILLKLNDKQAAFNTLMIALKQWPDDEGLKSLLEYVR
ncbi:MAG: multiheme c-type cytochrome [Chitinophagales bacterium]